ncbi:MAG: OmpA family protein [Granulosicoccaceae bacterium]
MNTILKIVNKPRTVLLPMAVATLITLPACATDDPNRRTKIGAGIGAIAGAVIAKQSGSDNVLLGAAIGTLAGGAVGNYQDKQQAALEVALENELLKNQVDVQRLENDVLLVRLNSEASFDVNSAQVKAAFYPTLDKIASETSTYNKTILHVVGYTDSDGSDAYNQVLSNKRANAVAGYLRSDGVIQERLRTEGRGETDPRLPNTSAANKTSNRRVEIYIKPIVKGDEQRALKKPVINR